VHINVCQKIAEHEQHVLITPEEKRIVKWRSEIISAAIALYNQETGMEELTSDIR
jgi:hypothetical protein